AAVAAEIARLRKQHPRVVLYDCHSIRSKIPRLFEGTLPNFNIGTNNGKTCAAALTVAVEQVCAATAFTRVTTGRFRGAYATRHYGHPTEGVHALQMELACRGYMHEPTQQVSASGWPTPYDAALATPMRAALTDILKVCIDFARRG